jgi:hypothetical protein
VADMAVSDGEIGYSPIRKHHIREDEIAAPGIHEGEYNHTISKIVVSRLTCFTDSSLPFPLIEAIGRTRIAGMTTMTPIKENPTVMMVTIPKLEMNAANPKTVDRPETAMAVPIWLTPRV